MPLSLSLPPVPLDSLRATLLEQMRPGTRLALSAQTGSGKSSRLPLWLRESGFCGKGRILLLEPRRLAAQTLAHYLATLLGERLGFHIGLRMRGMTRVSKDCEIEVVTEGVLTRLLLADQELSGVSCVIFDEFHERSLATDLGLTLLREIQKALRPDLTLIVMSATLDYDTLQNKLSDFRHLAFDVPGFPVTVSWLPPDQGIIPASQAFCRYLASVVVRAVRNSSGTLLVFLPGASEIARVAEELRSELDPRIPVYALTRHSPRSVREAIFDPKAPLARRIVLATSVAESSVTIPGVVCVVDSGLARRQVHDPNQGLDRLVTVSEAWANMLQRTGRAGRTASGHCLRLFSEAQANAFPKSLSPEILRSDLSELVLVLAAMGVINYEACLALPWLDAPPKGSFLRARDVLQKLGALDPKGQITPLGEKVNALPLAPRSALLVLRGLSWQCPELACVLAALIENFWRLAPKGSDIWSLVEDLGQNQKAFRFVLEDALRLARLLSLPPKDLLPRAWASQKDCGKLLLEAWPDFLAMRLALPNEGQKAERIVYKLRSGHEVALAATDPASQAPFLVVPCVLGKAPRERIRLCAAITPDVLESFVKGLCHEEQETSVTADGCVRSLLVTKLDALELHRKSVLPSALQCRKALVQHLQTSRQLPLGTRCRNWQARVLFLHGVLGAPWPKLDDAALLESLDTWLGPLLTKPLALQELTDTRLLPALRALLPYQLTATLDTLAPENWLSPAGTKHPVHYADPDKAPWVEVKLQACFGVVASPRLVDGRVPLILHLTSPAGRPLQITSDLAHFWSHGYQQVRGEMLGRYPKHPWPEDPLNALPTAKPKKRLPKS